MGELLYNLKIDRIPPRPPPVQDNLRLSAPIRKPDRIDRQDREGCEQPFKKVPIISTLAENLHPPADAVTQILSQLGTARKKGVHTPSVYHKRHDIARLHRLVEGNILEGRVLLLQLSNATNNPDIQISYLALLQLLLAPGAEDSALNTETV